QTLIEPVAKEAFSIYQHLLSNEKVDLQKILPKISINRKNSKTVDTTKYHLLNVLQHPQPFLHSIIKDNYHESLVMWIEFLTLYTNNRIKLDFSPENSHFSHELFFLHLNDSLDGKRKEIKENEKQKSSISKFWIFNERIWKEISILIKKNSPPSEYTRKYFPFYKTSFE
ncbi:MAG: hypothetical protein ACFFD1_05370, partial [Candidatus Thorarchaeota archaeon]